MPTYEFRCKQCGAHFERFQRNLADAEVHCPKCNAIATRLISAGAGLIFIGSGFYTNDYKKKTESKSSDAEIPISTKTKEEAKNAVTAKPSGNGN